MNRIDRTFADLRRRNCATLMPFITAGYPSLEATQAVLGELDAAGCGVCELGIPFSDPIADGPVIQASMTEALRRKVRPADIFKLVRSMRDGLSMGLVAMVSYSIVHRTGAARFIDEAAGAGFDGFIFPDLPLEEAHLVAGPVMKAGMICSLLIAPTTGSERAAAIARQSTGFVYIVARTGITGEREQLPADLIERLRKLRTVTDLPITVGFGISTPQHVAAVTAEADAAIVGSALVKRMGEHAGQPPQLIAGAAGQLVRQLCGGLRGAAAAAR